MRIVAELEIGKHTCRRMREAVRDANKEVAFRNRVSFPEFLDILLYGALLDIFGEIGEDTAAITETGTQAKLILRALLSTSTLANQ